MYKSQETDHQIFLLDLKIEENISEKNCIIIFLKLF